MRKLVPVVLLCAACSDNLLVDSADPGPPEGEQVITDPDFDAVTPRLGPAVCSTRAWPSIKFDRADVDLGVVEMPHGIAMFTVDRAGGELRGFAIDGAGMLVSKAAGMRIRDEPITTVSAAFVDESLVTVSAAADGSVFVDLVSADLTAVANVGRARGTMVADLPVAHVRGDRFVTLADPDEGITGMRFDRKWKENGVEQLSAKPARSITATRYLDDTMVVWSTDTTCHLTRVAAAHTSSRNFACIGGRIAMNEATGDGYLVHADGDTLMLGRLKVGGESELANNHILREHGTAPKIAFDGTRFWISYINQRHDLVVGYLDASGSLVSMALEGVRPASEAHDLRVIDGEVWLYGIDDAGVAAHRFCLQP